MRLNCYREELLSAVSVAFQAALPTNKAGSPALTHLRAVARPEGLTLEATDLEVSVRLDCVPGVEVIKEGEALLPPALVGMLRKAFGSMVEVIIPDHTMRVQGEGFDYDEVPVLAPGGYPDVMRPISGIELTIGADKLRTMLKRTMFATAEESVRFAMHGVLFEPHENALRLVGSDGKRLSIADSECVCSGSSNGENKHIVPTKGLTLLAKVLAGSTAKDVVITLGKSEVSFVVSNYGVRVRLLEGRYPDYRSVMPPLQEKEVTLDQTRLAGALGLASAVCMNRDDRSVTLVVAENTLTISSKGEGKSKVVMPADNEGGLSGELRLDCGYVEDFLKTAENPVRLSLPVSGNNTMALFRCGDEHRYLVMPLV